jgi:hypothetical protein
MAESPPPAEHADVVAPAASRVVARRTRRRWPARLAIAAGSALAMTGVVILGLFLLLSSGPISTPFLTERVAEALERRLGENIDVDVRETKLEKTAEGIEVHIYDVVFRDLAGREILRSPEALVGFDPLQLAAFKLAPRRLSLKGMAVKAEVRMDGEVRLTTGGPSGAAAAPARLEDALGFLVAVARTGTLSGLSDISLTDASLVIDDQRVAKEITFERMSAVFETRGEGVSALTGSISRAGAVIPFRIEATAKGEGAKLDLTLRDVPLRVAETIGGTSALPFTSASKALVKASLSLDAAARPTSGRLEASLSPGKIDIPSIFGAPVGIEDARLVAEWSGATDRVESLRLTYAGDGTRGALAGVLHLPGEGQPDYRFEGRTEGVALAPLRAQDRPIEVAQGVLKARVGQALDHVTIESLTLDGPETAIRLSGHVKKAAGGAVARLDVSTGRMPVRTAIAFWPGSFAGEARTWLAGAVRTVS